MLTNNIHRAILGTFLPIFGHRIVQEENTKVLYSQ